MYMRPLIVFFLYFFCFISCFPPPHCLSLSSPIQVFHDPHKSSIIARENMKGFRLHQDESKNLFSKLKDHQKLEVGMTVLLKLKPKAFRKEQNAFQPKWTKEQHVIESIDKTIYPPLYKLRDFPITNRRYKPLIFSTSLRFLSFLLSRISLLLFPFCFFPLLYLGSMHTSCKRLDRIYHLHLQ